MRAYSRFVTTELSGELFVLTLTNHGRACTLQGLPIFTSRDRAGHLVERSSSDYDGAPAAPLVRLATGQTASSSYAVTTAQPPHCGPTATVAITLPGTTDELAVTSIPTTDHTLRVCGYSPGPLYPGVNGSPNSPY